MIDLYPDQEELMREIRGVWRAHNRILVYAMTGFGKTRIAAKIIEGCISRGMRVNFVVPRISLINQTAKAFMELGLHDITVQWGETDLIESALITISSAATMVRREKRTYDLTIVDECDLRVTGILTWMNEFPEERYLGLTATPFASWLGNYYTVMAKSKSMRWLIDNKRLSEYEVFAPDCPDMSTAKVRAGEYVESDLERIMGDALVVGKIVDNWVEHGNNDLTMVLCVNINHANFLLLAFQKITTAEVIIGATPIEEREMIFKRVKEGLTRVLLSVECLTQGFDEPRIINLINARPTKSRRRYIQGMGRVLRYYPGKVAKIFDHSGTTLDASMGLPEDIFVDELSSKTDGFGKNTGKEEPEEKPVKQAKKCPSCNYLKPASVYVCPKCGFKPIMGVDVETDDSRGLVKLKGKKKPPPTMEDKKRFYGELLAYRKLRKLQGKGFSVDATYREKFGVWPIKMDDVKPIQTSPSTLSYIKLQQKAYFAKRRGIENNRRAQG